LVLILAALLLSGCDSSEEAVQPGAAAKLAGTGWGLTTLNDQRIIEGTEIELFFEEAYLGGSMTCNGYGGGPDGGKYVAADDGTLMFPSPIAVTAQDCPMPERVMEQEAAYMEALRSAASCRVVDGHLEIENAAGETILVFARRED
jgi:heat shock protein HslJ